MDLTKITTPFGLLDAETQKALREHGGPYEYYIAFGRWEEDFAPPKEGNAFHACLACRVKPQPPKPREWWFNTYHKSRAVVLYASREEADNAMCMDRIECIHVREVLE